MRSVKSSTETDFPGKIPTQLPTLLADKNPANLSCKRLSGFISMQEKGLLNDAKEAVEGVRWVPSWGQQRMEGMLDSSPDWCVSRQRTWGVPITLFTHKQSGELHPNTVELMEKVALKNRADRY